MAITGAGTYRAALRAPGAGVPAAFSLVARLPIAMAGLALLLYVGRTTSSFAVAGAVGSAALIGVAVGSVVQGRLVDRIGPTRALLPVAAVFTLAAAGTVAAVETRAPTPALLAIAAVLGATQPATPSASRALWARLLPEGAVLDAALTYEAISLEVFFILGPGLAGILATAAWPGTGTVVAIALLVVGTVGFALTPAVRRWRPEPAQRGAGPGVWRAPGLRTLVVLAGGFGVVVGSVEVAIPAAATAAGDAAVGGFVLGAWAPCSVAVGLLYGLRPWPRDLPSRGPVLLGGFGVLVALAGVPGLLGAGFVGLAAAVIVAGALITPQATTHSLLVEDVAPRESAAEAFAWVMTAVTAGLSLGQGVSGQVVEAAGPSAAVAVGGAGGVVLGLVAWARRATLRRAEVPAGVDGDAGGHPAG